MNKLYDNNNELLLLYFYGYLLVFIFVEKKIKMRYNEFDWNLQIKEENICFFSAVFNSFHYFSYLLYKVYFD